jgi:hypothetical protein
MPEQQRFHETFSAVTMARRITGLYQELAAG